MIDLRNIPIALLDCGRFCFWRRNGKSKIPCDPRTGKAIDVTAPHSWLPITELKKNFSQLWKYAGIGRINQYPLDGIIGIDLDNCFISPDFLELKPWARPYLEGAESYGEKSPSGTGLRIFVRGTLPSEVAEAGTRKIFPKGEIPGSPDSEVMIGLSGSYMSITGRRVSVETGVEVNQAYVDWLVQPLVGKLKSGIKSGSKSKVSTNTTQQCDSLSSVQISEGDIDAAIAHLSRPEICKYFAGLIACQILHKSTSEYSWAVAQSIARAGYPSNIGYGIWQRWRNQHGDDDTQTEADRKWKQTWAKVIADRESKSKSSTVVINHKQQCDSLSSVQISDRYLSSGSKPRGDRKEFLLSDRDARLVLRNRREDLVTVNSKIQSVVYQARRAGCTFEETAWLTYNFLRFHAIDRLVTLRDLEHWIQEADNLYRIHQAPRKWKRGVGNVMRSYLALQAKGKSPKAIARKLGITREYVYRLALRAKASGLIQAPVTFDCPLAKFLSERVTAAGGKINVTSANKAISESKAFCRKIGFQECELSDVLIKRVVGDLESFSRAAVSRALQESLRNELHARNALTGEFARWLETRWFIGEFPIEKGSSVMRRAPYRHGLNASIKAVQILGRTGNLTTREMNELKNCIGLMGSANAGEAKFSQDRKNRKKQRKAA
jgi:hypothetical protein